jgi:oligopeptidase A
MSKSAFLQPVYPLPCDQLKLDDLPEALELGLQLARAKLAKVEALPLSAVSYETLLLPMEYLSEELDHAWGLANMLAGVDDSPQLRQIIDKYLPTITEFYTSVGLSPALWQRVKQLEASPQSAALPPLQRRSLELTVKSFRLSGADLPDAQKAEYTSLQQELSTLCEAYSKATLDALNSYEKILPPGSEKTCLSGLPPTALEIAAASAKAASKEGYRFTLHAPSVGAIMTYASDASLREELWHALTQIGRQPPHQTAPLIAKILRLRERKAELLGFKNFAELITQNRMLKSPEAIASFTADLTRRVRGQALKEFEERRQLKAQLQGTPASNTPFEPWDASYYSEKLQQSQLELDSESLRPYFEFNSVLHSLFDLAGQLFGVSFRKVEGHAAWHPSVAYYEIYDRATERLIGGFYTDFFPRPSKRSGAWMSEILCGRAQASGHLSPHIGFIGGNFTPPTDTLPSLLTHDEVLTLYHEFGHLLHLLMTEVPIPSLAGTRVFYDFVEVPSQLLENYCYSAEYLPRIAKHYKTGEALPAAIIERLRQSQRFLACLQCLRQLQFGALDILLHTTPTSQSLVDIEGYLRSQLTDYELPTSTRPPMPIYNFGHLFADTTGYAAGYYSYKWSEILEADLWKRFEEVGILSAEIGQAYRRKLLSRGNAAHPQELFESLMGRTPSPAAYLERLGVPTA